MLSGEFREDLYYRLKVIELTVPPLRERRDEIPTLTDFFLARYSRRYNRPARPLSDELRQLFLQYDWPGNIRELENMIKRFVILQDEQLVIREIERNMQRAAAAASWPRRSRAAAAGWRHAGRRCRRLRVPPRCRARRRPVAAAATPEPADADDTGDEPSRGGGGRRIARRGREGGGDESRARGDRADAAAGPLEPPQGGADPRRQLQDAAQQDQGVRHQPRLMGCGTALLVSRRMARSEAWPRLGNRMHERQRLAT